MATTFWIAVIFGGIGLLVYLRRHWKYPRLPPGPKGPLLIGNAFQQDPKHPFLMWSKWAEQYGDIFTMWNFGKPMVMCNSFEVIWEMLVSKSNDFAGRPYQYVAAYCSSNNNNVGNADFNRGWAHRKKVFMKGLKMYGEGIKCLEDLMVDIIAELVEDMEATKGQPFDPQKIIELTLANSLSLLLFGSKFEKSDSDFHALVKYTEQSRQLGSRSIFIFAYDVFPWLHYLPLSYSKLIDKFVSGFMDDWMPRQIQKAKMKYNPNDGTCVMDAFFKQLEQDLKSGADHLLQECHLVTLAEDFFLGGMNTSTAALYALFAILTVEPDVQTKAREEVDKVLQGRHPTFKERESMPYILAMLEEVFRYAVIVPGLPHKATTDSNLCGHFIPKNTELFPNIWFLCHDATFWDEPYAFKPERFLDSNGEIFPVDHPRRKRVLVFGGGRRVCAGEQLARNRIFLIMTSLLQRFIFMPAAEDQLPVCDPKTFQSGFAIMPEPYQLRAVPRV